MPYAFPLEVNRLVQERLATGQYSSEDEVLLEAMRALQDRDEALAGIREGLQDFEAGRVRALADVDAEMRSRFGIRRES